MPTPFFVSLKKRHTVAKLTSLTTTSEGRELQLLFNANDKVTYRKRELELRQGSVSPVFEKPAGTSKSPAGTKTGDKYASGGPGRPGPP